jgi:hypothetical protein
MKARAHRKAVILAVSLVLAVFVFVPQQAFAHAGHRHEPISTHSTPEQAKPVAAKPVVLDPAEVQADRLLQAASALAAWLEIDRPSWPLTSAPDKGGKSCPAGCCQSMGAHCCPVTLLDTPPIVVPPLHRAVYSDLTDRGAGTEPAALSEPPKSLI